MKIVLLLISHLFFYKCPSQVAYLNFTGLTNTNPISSIAIGSTGITFNASMTSASGAPPNPDVYSDGDFSFRMNSATSKQCINLIFSSAVNLYITDNTGKPASVFNETDSLSTNTSSFILTDPLSYFDLHTTSVHPNTNVTSYTTWNITFAGGTSFQICGQRNVGSPTNNAYLPIRFGILTTTLPIELVDFNAKVIEKKVQIAWVTASESNNDYFTVERSKVKFEWEKVMNINGAGNSSALLSYSTIDDNPYSGTSYYRLKQTDFNGICSYSPIKSVYLQKNCEGSIYPNPTFDYISIDADNSELQQIIIYNILGAKVTSLVSFNQVSETSMIIDISMLNPGLYYLKTKTTMYKVYKNN